MITDIAAQKFVAYLDKISSKRGCWLWTGGQTVDGYGLFYPEYPETSKHVVAHKVSYELHVGPIPEGKLLRHKCDTPLCCNPKHLIPGTQTENMEDCIRRGRIAHGERHPASQLTNEQVLEIYKLCWTTDLTQGRIGKMFGVNRNVVSHIKSGYNYGHITGHKHPAHAGRVEIGSTHEDSLD